MDKKTVKHNFIMHTIDGVLFTAGMYFASMGTILPAFVAKLTDSEILIGLIPSVMTFGWFIPQLFSAYFTESYSTKREICVRTGLGQRIPWFILFIGAFLFGKSNPALALIIFFVCYAAATISTGINSPIWMDFVGRTVPTEIRGKLFSIRTFTGCLMGVGGGIAARYILGRFEFPVNYSICFFLYFFFTSVSLIFVALVKETPYETGKKRDSLKNYLKSLPAILKSNKNFTWFIIARMFLIFLVMAGAFYTVYALKRLNAKDADVATFMLVSVITQSVSSLIWGFVADKKGHIFCLRIGYLFTISGAVIAFFSNSLHHIYFVYAFAGFGMGAMWISGITIILEFCRLEERPTYIGLSNTILFPFSTALPIIAGMVIQNKIISYNLLFLISASIASIGWFILLVLVKEPRKLMPEQGRF
jgi:MFS family permease